jgi:6-phosphogluconolactonase/glucosamine-6-phosphate isomerase/deaminase
MNVTIITEQDPHELTQKAGAALNKLIAERDNKPLLLLLSGGSSLELLDLVDETSLSTNVTIGMLDDRYSLDPKVNSCHLVQKTSFYLKALRKGAVFLDSTTVESEILEKYAERYEGYIKKWIKKYPDGKIRATVGIGSDGHTSGVLPHPEDPQIFEKLFNSEKLIVGYDVGQKNSYRYRMTSTFTLMRKFEKILTYIKGENKKEALQKVMAETGSLPETPGRIIRELPAKVEVFTDIVL